MAAVHAGGADRGPACEQQLQVLRSVAQAAIVTSLEESLAIGLEALDLSTALLLGRCCRLLGEAEAALLRTGRGAISAAEVLIDGEGRGVVPLPQEFARLEGYRWAHVARRGRGTVFRVDQFGARGETVLCPGFCKVRAPATGAFLEAALARTGRPSASAGGCNGGERRPAEWLRHGLGELAAQVSKAPKAPYGGILSAVQSTPSIVLVVPVATVCFRDPPEPRELGRKAVRRHPLHVDSVEMGARLLLTFVPPASTPSGDLDKADAENLDKACGAQLFALSGQRGRFCVRRHGGPALDLARISGATLDDVCDYLIHGWYNTLAAAPSTWHHLFVTVKRCDMLEVSLGPQPGKGSFMALDRSEDPPVECAYCGDVPVVGCEVFEAADVAGQKDTSEGNGLCANCAAFVPGSQVFLQKLALSQYIAGQPEKMVGTADESLDDALLFQSTAVTALPIDFDPFASSSASGFGPSASIASSKGNPSGGAVAVHDGWPDEVVPQGSTVLAVSGIASLRAPADGWDFESAQTCERLGHELCIATGSDRRAVRVIGVKPEVGSTALLMVFVLLHPAILEGTDPDVDLAASGRSLASSLKRDGANDPKVPLKMFRRLISHLLEMSEDVGSSMGSHMKHRRTEDGTPSSKRSEHLRVKAVATHSEPLLRPADPLLPAWPCGLALCKPSAEARRISMQAVDMPSNQVLDRTLERLKNLIPQAQERLREDHKARTKLQEMLDKQEHFGAIAALPPSGGPEDLASTAAETNPGRAVLAIRSFRPTHEELSLRLRELTAIHQAERCHQLLQIWGGVTGSGAEGGGASAAGMAVLERDKVSFRGQSALDLAFAACDRHCIDALLLHVPKAVAASVDASDGHGADRVDSLAGPSSKVHSEEHEKGGGEAVLEARAVTFGQEEHSPGSSALLGLLNAPNPVTGYTPMYAAAMTPGDHAIHLVRDLVQRGADINTKGTKFGDPPLYAAVSRGEVALARTMLELRSDVNARAGDGRPLLQVSIEKDDRAMIQLLMASPNCDLDAADSKGRTPLVAALRFRNTMRGGDLAIMLVKARCSVDRHDINGAAPILHAASVHKQELCDLLLERRADKDAIDPADGSHILHLVVQTGNMPLMQGLLDRNSNIHLPHPRDGRTVLHLAAGLRNTALVRQLLELMAEVNAQSFVGDTALRLAVQAGDIEAAELLCKAKADTNLANRSGCAPMHAAVSSGDVALPQLLAKYSADPHLADVRRWRPIHYGASGGDGQVVEWLLANRADPDSRSFHGRTPRQLGRAGASKAIAQIRETSRRVRLHSSMAEAAIKAEESQSISMPLEPSRGSSSMPLEASGGSVALETSRGSMPLEASRGSCASGLPSLLATTKARPSLMGTPRRSTRRTSMGTARSSLAAEVGAKLVADQQTPK